jgi:hypothetical protein
MDRSQVSLGQSDHAERRVRELHLITDTVGMPVYNYSLGSSHIRGAA